MKRVLREAAEHLVEVFAFREVRADVIVLIICISRFSSIPRPIVKRAIGVVAVEMVMMVMRIIMAVMVVIMAAGTVEARAGRRLPSRLC